MLEDLLEPAHRQRLPAIRSDMQQLAGITEQLGLLAERDQPAMAVHQLSIEIARERERVLAAGANGASASAR